MIFARVALQRGDQVEQDRHLVHAHAGGRLVEHEDRRLERDHQRDFQLALIAVRQRGRRNVAPVAERDALEHGVGARDQLAVAHPRAQHVVMHARGRLDRETHVLHHREAGKQIGQLKRAADAGAGARRRGQARDVAAVEQDLAGARGELSGDQVEVGRLAGAVRPDDRGQFAGAEGAAHRIDGDMAAEADGEIAGFEGGHRGAAYSVRSLPLKGGGSAAKAVGWGSAARSRRPPPRPSPFQGEGAHRARGRPI